MRESGVEKGGGCEIYQVGGFRPIALNLSHLLDAPGLIVYTP